MQTDPGGRRTGNAITLPAPAKINVTLEVVERLPNGYHAIRSVMIKLHGLADTVRVRLCDGARDIRIHSDSPDIPQDATNLCHRAADRYLQHAGGAARIDIEIRKSIPVAAGLGGGSSDAAAVLLALNELFEGAIAPAQLRTLAAGIGKDLPFFLDGATIGRASGMGEIVEPITAFLPLHFLLVNPRVAVSTPEAYSALHRESWFMDRRERVDRTAAMADALVRGNVDAIAAALYNDFETVVERMHPRVKEIKQALLAFGARGALMSGSGPTVFGIFDSEHVLAQACAALRSHDPGFVVERG